jgi:hypothetical protein
MNWLEILGWLGIVLIAVYISALSTYLMVLQATGWAGRTAPLAGMAVSAFLWWLVFISAPFSIQWGAA